MKHLFFCSSLIILSLSACSGKQNTTAGTEIETPPADTVAIEIIPELPPLEAGEVFLKGKEVFSEETELTGTHIEEPDTFIFKPIEPTMVIRDSLLIMGCRDAPFYVFRYPSFTHVKTIGDRGNGPDEFMLPVAIESSDPDYLCYMLDGYNGNLYGLDSHLEAHFIKKAFDRHSIWDYVEHAYPAGEKAILYQMGSTIYRVPLENDSIQREKLYNLRLQHSKGIPATGALCTNPGRDRMVFAYKYTKIIKFMDMEAKTVRTLNFEQSEFDEKTLTVINGLDANVTHYMQVLPTRDYVYITHSGRTPYVVAAEARKATTICIWRNTTGTAILSNDTSYMTFASTMS
ncbi:hypothetical protein [Parabacteroides sp. AF48-14]|uniref:hypothetical protein n=1 Tax=Parabacteroides sp. AF48-14 TaxID=2292052 RepID=UPI001F2E0F4A|nr:hypothetical protein [Parabacteroides sp. AF48-14]